MKIDSFDGPNKFLSNFFIFPIEWNDKIWITSEHAFQAAKTLFLYEQDLIRLAPTPGKAKRIGKEVTLRSDWEQVKLGVMEEILRIKFAKSPMKELLFNTADAELIEGNTWGDTFWGVCKGVGENHLGKILMKIRSDINGKNN